MPKKPKSKEVLKTTDSPPKNKESFYYWENDVLVLNILGTANAKMDVIGKVKGNELKVSVKATPEAGKASDYMLQFLAKEFGVSAKDVKLVFGQCSPHKQFRIKNPKNLPAAISREEKSLPGKNEIPSKK